MPLARGSDVHSQKRVGKARTPIIVATDVGEGRAPWYYYRRESEEQDWFSALRLGN
jgi:hypothetical protein